MRIGIDVRPLSRPSAGISRAVKNILEQLQEIDLENSYYLYSDRDFELALANGRWCKRISRGLPFLPGSVWLQTTAREMAKDDNVEVFWGTAHTLPLDLPSSMRKVLTIHDLTWAICPQTMSLYNRLVHHFLIGRSFQGADIVCVPSESTRAGLIGFFGKNTKPIEVIRWGIEERYFPRDPTIAARHIAKKFSTSSDYICTVGTIEPRKNLATLIEALGILRDQYRCKTQLLIAGAKGWKDPAIYKQLAKSGLSENEVRFLGYVPEEDMPDLYSGASVFVFPSLYEGFGFPLIEAMACNVPVIASNFSAIPEVVGGAALLFDPHNPNELAQAISTVRSDQILRGQMICSGILRSAEFKWRRSALAILAALTSQNECRL